MITGKSHAMRLSGKSILTFLIILGTTTYLLSNKISTATESGNDALVSSFTADKKSETVADFKGKVPFHVTFDSKQLVGPMDSYSWNFGDGEMAQGPVASHTFFSEGTYSVTLIAKQHTGEVHQEQVTVSVTSQQ